MLHQTVACLAVAFAGAEALLNANPKDEKNGPLYLQSNARREAASGVTGGASASLGLAGAHCVPVNPPSLKFLWRHVS